MQNLAWHTSDRISRNFPVKISPGLLMFQHLYLHFSVNGAVKDLNVRHGYRYARVVTDADFELCAGNNTDSPFSFSVFPTETIYIYTECWLFLSLYIMYRDISRFSESLVAIRDADAEILVILHYWTVCR